MKVYKIRAAFMNLAIYLAMECIVKTGEANGFVYMFSVHKGPPLPYVQRTCEEISP